MSDGHNSQPSTSSATVQWSPPCRQFEFRELQLATNDFDESLVIGRGGFGKVYRGIIYNGYTPVNAAIKRLDSRSNQGAPEFSAEVEMLSKLRHCHLVSLFGYCNHGKEMILVYEYMSNGTLADHLHKQYWPLSWLERLKICVGAARGLDYLHTGTGIEFGVIHRDVKSSNILLDEFWAAKISDFGLSRIAPTNQTLSGVDTLVKGTFGYFDPDYYYTGRLTRKSDVYAFGVVLLEVLCRKRAVDSSLGEDQPNLARWVQESIKERKLKHIIDPGIRGEISRNCLKDFVRIAERCLISNPRRRSTMAEVVVGLESVLAEQQKIDNPLQVTGRTMLSRIVDKFSKVSAGSDSKPSSNTDSKVLKELKFSGIKEVTFEELKRATNNFSEHLMLSRDRYVQVYLGRVDNKMFSPSMYVVKWFVEGRVEAWLTEVNLLVQLSHPNISSLLGYCAIPQHLLVYEYFPYGSLDHFLNTGTSDHIDETLSWGRRLNIMIGVARGLAYLHSFGFIHRGLKSSAILLDQDFNARLFDFEIGKFSSRIDESFYFKESTNYPFGDNIYYWDPDYFETGRLSVKSDIYSFGILLLETITGMKPFDWRRPQRQVLINWAKSFLAKKRKLKKIMDPCLEGNYPLEGALECAALVLQCTACAPKNRPSSEEVLRSLEDIYAVHSLGMCNPEESNTESGIDTECGSTDDDTEWADDECGSTDNDTEWADDTVYSLSDDSTEQGRP